MTPEGKKHIDWIVDRLKEDAFSDAHLKALTYIVGLFIDCEDAEAETFKFAKHMTEKYVGDYSGNSS